MTHTLLLSGRYHHQALRNIPRLSPRHDLLEKNQAYCEELRMQRRCKATLKDGKPCKGYAVWGGEHCVFHGGKPLPGKRGKNPRPVCHCGTNGEGGGYLFPHTAQAR